MKIAFFHELHKGGARRGTNEFAKQLKTKGHQVDLYTIDPVNKEEIVFYSNIYSFRFASKKWIGNNWKIRLYKDTVELIKLWKLNKKIAIAINIKKYDFAYITASQFIETPFILNYLKIPNAYYLNDPYYRLIYEPRLFKPVREDILRKYYEKSNRLIRKYIDKYNVSKINLVLASSIFSGKSFEKAYRRKGFDVAYYGVNDRFFTPIKAKKDIDILFIGSYDYLDGYPLFQEILKSIGQKLKVRTVLVENEWLNDNQLRDIYRRTKILIATSYNEPLGLVPLEAMACGAIVLSVDEAGYRESVIDSMNGYLIKRDSTLFAEKIRYLLKHHQTRKKMSEFAKNNIKTNWTWRKRGEQLEQILLNKISSSKKQFS